MNLDNYKCISFDLFDTLVSRDVREPKDIFRLCERRFPMTYHMDGIENYAEVRVRCEQAVRMHQEGEITYGQIFEEMEKYSNKDTVRKYMDLETQAELDLIAPNQRGKHIYDKAMRLRKRIIIVTDMYLPRDIIEQLLDRNGYSGYDKLYLSSELGMTKSKGSLYRYIIEQEMIKPDAILHVGDNWKSDILQARRKGIRTYYLKKDENKTQIQYNLDNVNNGLDSNVLLSFLKNKEGIFPDDEDRLVGYSCLGPLLYGFVDWLDSKCEECNIDHILFFSRDGYLMKKLYEQMLHKRRIPYHYFYASRRALQVASICLAPSYDETIAAMSFPRIVKLDWLLSSWGLDVSAYKKELKDLGLAEDIGYQREGILENEKLRELFDLLKEDIVANSKRECEAFIEYVEETGCQGRIAIVDIGWNGNMQKAFEKIVRHYELDMEVYGYYLGIIPNSPNQQIYKMQGYLFQSGKNVDLFLRERYVNCMLELFLVAPHGSMKRYHLNEDGKAELELEEFEYQDVKLYEDVRKVQNAALEFASDFAQVSSYVRNNELVYSGNLMSHFLYPIRETADYWGRFQMWDGGWVHFVQHSGKGEIWWYLLHPRVFIDDFLKSSWKIGFMKKVFRVKLPYAKILVKVRMAHDNANRKGGRGLE